MDARYNRYERDPESNRRYKGGWVRLRAGRLAEKPLCELCQRDGRLTPASEVHHIVPLAAGGTHAPDNLMSLCKACHSRITIGETRRRVTY
jgi:5-methylcytosine-specific restriction protein A